MWISQNGHSKDKDGKISGINKRGLSCESSQVFLRSQMDYLPFFMDKVSMNFEANHSYDNI